MLRSPWRFIGTRLARTAIVLSLVVVSLGVAGCEQPNPLQTAEPIGEFPVWGESFGGEPVKEGGLMDMGAQGPAPTGPDGVKHTGGSAVPGANPMAKKKDYGGGNPNKGKRVYINKCALCHGDLGQGGEVNGLQVPTLRDPEWHDKVDDGYIGLTIAHGKGGGKMPAFIGQISQGEIKDTVAFVRTLKQKDEEGGW